MIKTCDFCSLDGHASTMTQVLVKNYFGDRYMVWRCTDKCLGRGEEE